MAGDFRFGLANGADMITRVAMITRVTAMITGRVAMMNVAVAVCNRYIIGIVWNRHRRSDLCRFCIIAADWL